MANCKILKTNSVAAKRKAKFKCNLRKKNAILSRSVFLNDTKTHACALYRYNNNLVLRLFDKNFNNVKDFCTKDLGNFRNKNRTSKGACSVILDTFALYCIQQQIQNKIIYICPSVYHGLQKYAKEYLAEKLNAKI